MVKVSLKRRAEIGQEKRARTLEKIVDAAIRAIGEKGESCTTVDVIEEAQISRGTFYNYFEDMDALNKVVADRVHDEFIDESQIDLTGPPERQLEQMIGLIGQFLLKMRAREELGRLIVKLFSSGRSEDRFIGKNSERLFQTVIRCGQEAGYFHIRSMDVAYDLHVGTYLMTLNRLLKRPLAEAPQLIEDASYHLLLGLGTEREIAARLAGQDLDIPGADDRANA